MEKRLIATVIAAAFAGSASVAVAGPVSVTGAIQYSSEALGGVATATAVSIKLGSVAYTIDKPFAAGATVTIRYTLANGPLATCPALTITSLDGSVTNPTTPAPDAAPNDNRCSYSATPTGAVAANSTLSFVGGTASPDTASALAAGNLTASVSIPAANEQSGTVVVATAAHAFSARWVSSAQTSTSSTAAFATLPESSRVDVTATPVSTAFTNSPTDITSPSTTVINLGAFQLLKNSGTFYDVDGITKLTLASLSTNKWKLKVTGPFIENTNAGQVFAATTDACGGTTQNFTVASTGASLDYTAPAPGTASFQTVYVCYAPNAGKTTPTAISTGQFVGSATTLAGSTNTPNMTGEEAQGNLYLLESNGAQIDLRVMTTSGTTGWNTVVRVINTGNLAVPVTASYIKTDGTAGASGTIIANLAPGATEMLSAAQIEAALGVSLASTGNPPRLRIAAPTSSLRAQAWVQTPNGAWFMGTPAQGSEAGGANSESK